MNGSSRTVSCSPRHRNDAEDDGMKIIIVSGFLGAGKTTFLNRCLRLFSEKTVVIENEFGDIGIDGALLAGGTAVKEIAAGCICCSLAGDFRRAVAEIAEKGGAERLFIEPSGIARLTDVVNACEGAAAALGAHISQKITVVDLKEFDESLESFGIFYEDQIIGADKIFLTRVSETDAEKAALALKKITRLNPSADVCSDDFRTMGDEALLSFIEASAHIRPETGGAVDMEEIEEIEDATFESVSINEPREVTEEELRAIFAKLRSGRYGRILRAKGIIKDCAGTRLRFDYTPNSDDIVSAAGCPAGCAAVLIGSSLRADEIRGLFEGGL